MAIRPAAKKPGATTKSLGQIRTVEHEDELGRDLRLLKAILEARTDCDTVSSNPQRPKTPLSTAPRRNGKATRQVAPAGRDANPSTTEFDGGPASIQKFSVAEQKKLAMNCFNRNLKILSTAAKKTRPPRSDDSENKINTSAKITPQNGQKGIENAQESNKNISMNAECACAALAVLRTHDTQESTSEDSTYKREQGAILLLDKMISLNLEDIAHIEMSRIYEQYWKQRRSGIKSQLSASPPAKIEISVLLSHNPEMREKKDFDMLASFQSQLLRLAIVQGPLVVNKNFVHALRRETKGCPTNVVLSAHENGYITSQMAGETLRTISRAVSRIYAEIAKRWQDLTATQAFLALELLSEAQLTRLVSWQMLNHTPDLDHDFWAPVERGIKLHCNKQAQDRQPSYASIKVIVERLKSALQSHSLRGELPPKLSQVVARLAEGNGDFDTALLSLHELWKDATGIERLSYLCRIVSIKMQDDESQGSDFNQLEEAAQLLIENTKPHAILTADDLAAIVNLRKSCSKRLSLPSQTSPERKKQGIKVSCLRVLSNILTFSFYFTKHEQSGEKLRQITRLSALKTIEAILDAEKYATSSHDSILSGYLTALEGCITSLHDNESAETKTSDCDTQQSVSHTLRIRISNVLWRAHLRPDRSESSTYTAVKLAQISISCLDGLPISELSKAALGPRLEKLSNLQVQAGNAEDARNCIRRAVKHYISAGALADAVESSLSKPTRQVWVNDTSIACQLGRALHSYNISSVGGSDDIPAPVLFYDDETLPAIHRGVLLEHQILFMLKNHRGSLKSADGLEQAQKVIKLTASPQYHIWRLRFVSAFVYRASKIPDVGTDELSILVKYVDSVLCADVEDSSMFLGQYRSTLEAQARIQCALLGKSSDIGEIRSSLITFSRRLESCSTTEDFESVIDDFDSLKRILEAFTDQALAVNDYEVAARCLKIMICLEERYISSERSLLTGYCVRLALCHVRLDDINAAGVDLADVAKSMKDKDCDLEQILNFHMTSAEFYLAASALEKCKSSLQEAGLTFAKIWPKETALSTSKQIERDSTIAKVALLASKLANRQGNPLLANRYARQATKISTSIWSALGKRISHAESSSAGECTVVSLTQDISKLNDTSHQSSATIQAAGSRYWAHLDMHVRSIKNLADILSHLGLCEDALHYLKQLKLLASSIFSSRLSLNPAPTLSLLFAKAGRTQEAAQMIKDCTPFFDIDENQYGLANAILSCCEAQIAQGDFLHAKSLVLTLAKPACIEITQNIEPELDQKKSKPKSQARRGVVVKGNVKAQSNRLRNTSKAKTETATRTATQSLSTKFSSFDQALNEDRRKAILHACKEYSETSSHVIDNGSSAVSGPGSPENLVREAYEEAKLLLSDAWHKLSVDALASVLTESAVALPSKVKTSHRRARISVLQGGGDSSDNVPQMGSILSPDSNPAGMQSVVQNLQSALKLCRLLLEERQQHCPTDMIQSLVRMEARISLLLSSMNVPFVVSSTDLVLRASRPKDYALERERMASIAEQATQDRSALATWPSDFSSGIPHDTLITGRHLNDLPASWLVISMALTEENDELLLTKTVAGRDPFLVRIPLRRSNEGEGIEEFLFDEAKVEMKGIIEAANFSSHDVRGTSDKATRAQWHSDRETLDRKLASLLENIELIWLGGFRGILSPHEFKAKAVEQFGQSLIASLDKNLPSRQKASLADERIEIHEHILEIFLGLGSPNDNDLDDSIMDLLYFVVDILQFNGERNAYDEIEWDAILVDVLDALRAFHETQTTPQPRHTILILDKELELFPWEALPCMINQPVSRMPSLGSIFERLWQMRARNSNEDTASYAIAKSTCSSAYILNPSGDLKSTQDLFDPILTDNLSPSNYTSLTNTVPSESQFSSLLQKSDIFLYIGHGSGAQYIRPRTIRALSSCAVTFLFGCSSAKMTEHGVFESTGLPKAYMLGHAPAVIGCLWDVTDKEIDRVALRTLVSWGLVDGDDERVREGLRKKGKKSKEKIRATGKLGEKTLIEAVKDGREACVLRYLCGAAVVVYGVPVVLE